MGWRARLVGVRVGPASLLLVAAGAGAAAAQEPADITVFAAASLADAFRDLGARFERAHPGTTVQFNFAGSHQLAMQLQYGARADVFASADRRWMRALEAGGLLAAAPRVFARNRLVVVLPAANPGRVRGPADLARPGLKLVVAAEAVPAGRYSRQVLARLEAAPGFPAGYAERVLANVVSEEESVRGVLGKVELGEADAGLAYASDAAGSGGRVRVLEIPPGAGILAEYPVAVLRDSPAPGLAAAFVGALLRPEGQEVLRRHGFVPPMGQAGRTAPAGR